MNYTLQIIPRNGRGMNHLFSSESYQKYVGTKRRPLLEDLILQVWLLEHKLNF